jgi:hypothetical protein
MKKESDLIWEAFFNKEPVQYQKKKYGKYRPKCSKSLGKMPCAEDQKKEKEEKETPKEK